MVLSENNMARNRSRYKKTLTEKYSPSEPCACPTCLAYCDRPGWWTVSEAERALEAGYGARMMLEISPDRAYGVLAPAFKGCEAGLAMQEYARNGCGFLEDQRCGLHGTGFQPLECRFCHHERAGLGQQCHADLEKDWNTSAGQALVELWGQQVKIHEHLFGK